MRRRMFTSGNRSRLRLVSRNKANTTRFETKTLNTVAEAKEESMFAHSELPVMDDDPVLFDVPPEWLVPGLRSAMRETGHDGLGLRSLIERAEVPPRPWRTARHRRSGRRTARVRDGRAQVRGTL